MNRDAVNACFGLGLLLAVMAGITCLLMWLLPHWHVYKEEMAGKAKLAEAESSRQILTLEAHAKMDSAKHLANAEIERARGVAEANKIIGEGLKGNHEYLIYLWIHALGDNPGREVIYVPTESNLPVLEAGRFNQFGGKKP